MPALLSPSPRLHVTVVGAGVVGLASARALLQAGHRVRLVDAAAGPGQGASARNGGQLSYAYVAPLASPALWRQLPALVWRRDSPLRLSARGVLGDLRWCLRFLAACRAGPARRTTAELLALAALSRRELDAWRTAGGAPTVNDNGKLVLLPDAQALQAAEAQVALQARLGCRQQVLTAAACRALEPALSDASDNLAGGIHTPGESVVDPARMTAALQLDLSRHADLELQYGTRVVGTRLEAGRVVALRTVSTDGSATSPQDEPVDHLVLAGGADSAALAALLGQRLPVVPLKGYSIDVPAPLLRRFPRLSVTDSARRIVFAPLGGRPGDAGGARLRVAGMAELVGHDRRVDPARIARLLTAAEAWFGLQGTPSPVDLQPWAGLRPATPDGMPFIGRFGALRNAWANTGHGPLGLTLALGSAAMLVAALEQRAAAINPLPYAAPPMVWA